jgi:hypothetical protein
MVETDLKLGDAHVHLSRIVDQLEVVHWQLVGLALSLPPSPTENLVEVSGEEVIDEAELRRIIECVLADRILLALTDIRSAMPRAEGAPKASG